MPKDTSHIDPQITGKRLFLIKNEFPTDCDFLVGPSKAGENSDTESISSIEDATEGKLISCHKSVLKSASEVFQSMFSDRYPNQPNPIIVNDVDPDHFQILIDYIYEEQLSANVVNMKNLERLIYLAEKYLMKGFANCIVKQIDQIHWPDYEIWRIYQIACFYKNVRLRITAHKRIRQRGKDALLENSFCELQPEYLKAAVVFLVESKSCSTIDIKEAMDTYAVVNYMKNCTLYAEARNVIFNT